jgi:hypothetical protein
MDPLVQGSGPFGPGDPGARTTVIPGPSGPGAGPLAGGGRPPRHGRRIWIPIAAVVAVVALVAGILLATNHKAGNGTAGPSPTISASGSVGSVGTPVKRGPITAATVFPQTQLNTDGMQFTRVAVATAKSCADAANGAFASALSSDKCKRVVRASYVDSHKQYVVTVGVAAMPDRADAQKVDSVKRFGPDVWFTALNGPSGSGASAASKTVGVGSDVVDGKFIVFALSSYSNGHNPTGHSSEIQTLTGLSQSFTDQVEQQLADRAKR